MNLGRDHYRKLDQAMAKLGAPRLYLPAAPISKQRRAAEAVGRQLRRREFRRRIRALNGRDSHGRQLHSPAPHLVHDVEATLHSHARGMFALRQALAAR